MNDDEMKELEDIFFEKDGKPYSILDIKPDPEILRMAREYDQKRAKARKKKIITRVMRTAAVFVLCIATMFTFALETSDAFRVRVYQLFRDEEQGGVTLYSQDEYDMIGDWEDYWYPTYMPEGFVIKASEMEKNESTMLFCSEDGIEIRIREYSKDTDISMDTDHTSMKEVQVRYYKGYLFTSDDGLYMSVYWVTDDRQLSVQMDGLQDEELILQIAEEMEYRE